jgi:hypothetical protein
LIAAKTDCEGSKFPQKASMRLSISILVMAATFCALTAVLYGWRFYARQQKLRLPFTRDLPESQEQSMATELELINKDLRRHCAFAVWSPLAILAIHLLQSYFGAAEESGVRLLLSAGGGLFFCVFAIYRATKLLNERTTLRLHYEGMREVGQQLEQLTRDGFHVYHGFPAENFNIDHVVVGSKGVFAVETKTHLKSAHKKRPEDATVKYDGRTLYFPRGEDYKIIDQAWKQAAWLSEWLGKAIGEPIAARAIVALPGWIVKRTSAEGIPVVNPQQFSSLFKYIKPRPLSNSMITRINHQLVQRCRSPEPIKFP